MAGVLKKKAVSRYDVSMLSQEVPDEVTDCFYLKKLKKNYFQNDNFASIDWQIWRDDSYSKDY